jgi:peptide deformylase
MLLKIVKYPSRILREKTKKVKDPVEPAIQKLINEMVTTMRETKGLGLAAPQVGKSLRICVIEEHTINQVEKPELYILINPKITAYSKEKVKMEEGCLSFPGKFFEIKRPETVKVRYLDENGKSVKIKADGILGRALQHEIDHLDGVLIIDKISPIRKLKAK